METDGGTHSGTVDAPDHSGHPRRWSILVALCAALLVIVLDNTVLNVALPAIAETFDASTAGLQAVVDAYAVVFAGLLIAAGVASDRFGRRRTVLVGLFIFGAASVAAAGAWSVWWLIAMRALMGVGAALVMPATLAVLVQVFPSDERPKAFAVWAAIASVAIAVGPVLGGFLTAVWSWAGVFLINVPIVAIALVRIARLVPESRDPEARPLDLLATMMITVGMLALVTAVIALGEQGSGATAAAGGVVALLALGGFAWRQRRSSVPMVEFGLYRNRQFAGASAAAALLTLGTGSALFVLTQYLQLVLGYTAFQAGLAIIPLAVGTVLGSIAGGRAPTRIGYRWSILIGFTVTAGGFVTLSALSLVSPYPIVALGLVLIGVGTGFSSPATTSTVLGAVPPDRAGMGSALNDTHQQLGIALGVAALGSLLAATYRAGLPIEIPDQARGSLATTLTYTAERGSPQIADTAWAAFTNAQSTTMLVAAGCSFAGAIVAAAVLRPDVPVRTGTVKRSL